MVGKVALLSDGLACRFRHGRDRHCRGCTANKYRWPLASGIATSSTDIPLCLSSQQPSPQFPGRIPWLSDRTWQHQNVSPAWAHQLSETEYGSTFTASIDEIDTHISDGQHHLSSMPRSHPLHHAILSTQANLHLQRYKLSDDDRDLNKSILQFTHAILFPFHLSTKQPEGPNPVATFFSLSEALFYRSLKHGQLEDVVYCVKCLHYLRDQLLGTSGVTRNEVTALLIQVLAIQVELEPGNAIHGVEEISVLCRPLLSSDLPEEVLSDVFASFALAVDTRLVDSWNQPSQEVVNCLREAHMRLPDLYNISDVLCRYSTLRFIKTKSNDDYENAMAFLEKGLGPNSSTDRRFMELSLGQAAELAKIRFYYYGNPEYLEEAILRYRNFLGSANLDDAERSASIQTLERLERTRFDELGVTAGLPEAHSNESGAIDLPPFSHLIASLAESNAVEEPLRTVRDCIRHLKAVDSMGRITDKADIEEAVKYCRLLLVWLQQSHGDVMVITHLILIKTGDFLYHAFKHTNNAEYLNESIGVHQDILKMPHSQSIRFVVVRRLISPLFLRYEMSKDTRDVEEIFRLYPIAATDIYAKIPNRFVISCEWADAARAAGHLSTSDAYKSATSLMPDSLAFAPNLEMQHFRLVAMRDNTEKLPLDYASYQVRTGRLREAIETLEQGRGLLWSEMRGLRTSIDHLRMVDSSLAEKFAAVNRDLEALTTSGSSMIWSNDGNVDDDGVMDPIGRVVVKQRNLLDERTSLITQIRSLPGFETFLTSLPFDTLRSAAAHGPVIIINHSKWHSDILILLHDSPPSVITTTSDFYHRAIELNDRLLNNRKQHRLESKQYQHALRYVLHDLYELVGRPVIEELRRLKIRKQSRVWWCPTSVFCSLPLHAWKTFTSQRSRPRNPGRVCHIT